MANIYSDFVLQRKKCDYIVHIYIHLVVSIFPYQYAKFCLILLMDIPISFNKTIIYVKKKMLGESHITFLITNWLIFTNTTVFLLLPLFFIVAFYNIHYFQGAVLYTVPFTHLIYRYCIYSHEWNKHSICLLEEFPT